MPKFIVQTREVHVQAYEVEADTFEEALSKVDGFEFHSERVRLVGDLIFSHCLERDEWDGYPKDDPSNILQGS